MSALSASNRPGINSKKLPLRMEISTRVTTVRMRRRPLASTPNCSGKPPSSRTGPRMLLMKVSWLVCALSGFGICLVILSNYFN